MIRRFENNDLAQIMDIWRETNIRAHSFIDQKYWDENFEAVREMIPEADVYVFEESGVIKGFAGLSSNYIAGIFVEHESQSRSIGRMLLNHVKSFNSSLQLSVYRNNERAVKFYLREGFSVEEESTDENTGKIEYSMRWRS